MHLCERKDNMHKSKLKEQAAMKFGCENYI